MRTTASHRIAPVAADGAPLVELQQTARMVAHYSTADTRSVAGESVGRRLTEAAKAAGGRR